MENKTLEQNTENAENIMNRKTTNKRVEKKNSLRS